MAQFGHGLRNALQRKRVKKSIHFEKYFFLNTEPFYLLSFANRRNGDGRDEGRSAFEFSVAFGDNPDGDEGVFTELVGEEAKPPAEEDDIGGGEDERQFLRRLVLVCSGTGVGVERESNQVAGVESLAMVFILMKLDEGGGSVEGLVSFIQEKG